MNNDTTHHDDNENDPVASFTWPDPPFAKPTHKKCTRCKQTLPVDDFSRNNNARDGRQIYCRKCISAIRAAQRIAKRQAGNNS